MVLLQYLQRPKLPEVPSWCLPLPTCLCNGNASNLNFSPWKFSLVHSPYDTGQRSLLLISFQEPLMKAHTRFPSLCPLTLEPALPQTAQNSFFQAFLIAHVYRPPILFATVLWTSLQSCQTKRKVLHSPRKAHPSPLNPSEAQKAAYADFASSSPILLQQSPSVALNYMVAVPEKAPTWFFFTACFPL